MNGQPNQQTIILHWIQKAEHDLVNAEQALLLKNDCPYDTVCFHAQQCVEKYIKALLLYHKIDFPKTHDIAKLVELIPLQHKISLTPHDQSKLSDYAIASRYPIDDMEDPVRKDADYAVALAKKIRAYVRNYLTIE